MRELFDKTIFNNDKEQNSSNEPLLFNFDQYHFLVDTSDKKYKLGRRVGFSEFLNNSLLLIDKNYNFSTLNLETLEEKPFLPPPLA